MPIKTRKHEQEREPEEVPVRDQQMEAAYVAHTLAQMLASQLALRQAWMTAWPR